LPPQAVRLWNSSLKQMHSPDTSNCKKSLKINAKKIVRARFRPIFKKNCMENLLKLSELTQEVLLSYCFK
jgi:hypothetical protein